MNMLGYYITTHFIPNNKDIILAVISIQCIKHTIRYHHIMSW